MIVLAIPLFKCPFLKSPDEIPVAACTTSLLLTTSPSTGTPGSLLDKTHSIRWRRVVRRTGLQTNRCVRVEMASDTLYCCRDATLLLLHSSSSWPSSSLLLVHPRLLSHRTIVRWWHLRRYLVHGSLTVRIWLRAISWWVPAVASAG